MLTKNEIVKNEQANMSHHLSLLLMELGFQAGSYGFGYIKYAIDVLYHNPLVTLLSICDELSKKTKKPHDAIEASMRNCIKSAFNATGFETLEKLYGGKIFDGSLPAARRFCSIVAEYLNVVWDGERGINL